MVSGLKHLRPWAMRREGCGFPVASFHMSFKFRRDDLVYLPDGRGSYDPLLKAEVINSSLGRRGEGAPPALRLPESRLIVAAEVY